MKPLKYVFKTKAKENQTLAGGDKKSAEYKESVLENSTKPIEEESTIKPIDTKKELAKIAGVSHNTIAKIKKIKQVAPTEVQDRIRNGDLTINKAYNYIKRQEIQEKAKEIEKPSGKYRIIYADPPWKYSDERDGNTTGAEDHYKTMSIDELCALPIKDMAEDNAVLFLWVTSPLLEECFAVIRAWGFKYKTSFVWDKVKHNMGHYNSVRHELLLIATKGSCLPDNKKLFDSVQTIERSDVHSEKPELFREIVDELYTYGKRIELFARKQTEGWEAWGNEVASS